MIPLVLALFLAHVTQAERDYRAGNFREAFAEFQTALDDPAVPQGPLLYDLGNCAYRLGRHPEALLFYRRAALRLPRDRELQFNLRLTEQQLGLDNPAAGSLGAALTQSLDSLTRGELLFLVTALQTIGIVGIVLLRRHRAARNSFAFILLIGLGGAARLVQLQWFAGPPAGVVLTNQLPVRAEPRAELAPLLTLSAGETVQVEEISDHWVRVTHPHGEGWTDRSGVGVVD